MTWFFIRNITCPFKILHSEDEVVKSVLTSSVLFTYLVTTILIYSRVIFVIFYACFLVALISFGT